MLPNWFHRGVGVRLRPGHVGRDALRHIHDHQREPVDHGLDANRVSLLRAELALLLGQARHVNAHGQQPQGQCGPWLRVSLHRWLLVSVSNPDHGTHHFATTMAGGCYVPLPAGKMEGASVFGQYRRITT
jgi:hypothetical protein